jgi:hypothetical protein
MGEGMKGMRKEGARGRTEKEKEGGREGGRGGEGEREGKAGKKERERNGWKVEVI